MKYVAIPTEHITTNSNDCTSTNESSQMKVALEALKVLEALEVFIRLGNLGMNQTEANQEYGEKCLHDTVEKLFKYGVIFKCKTEEAKNESNCIEHHIRYTLVDAVYAERLIKLFEPVRFHSLPDKRART